MTNISSLPTGFNLRVATPADADRIRYVHLASLWGISAAAYGPEVIDAIVRHYPTVDMTLIAAGTYHVIEQGGEIVACGGWTPAGKHGGRQPGAFLDRNGRPAHPVVPPNAMLVRAMFVHPNWTRRGLARRILERVERERRQAGCDRSTLFATLTGLPLYENAGYRAVERWDVCLPGSAPFPFIQMQKELALTAAA